MPLIYIIAIAGAAILAAGEGVNLAGQGAQNIGNATARTALLGAALYLGYVALKAK